VVFFWGAMDMTLVPAITMSAVHIPPQESVSPEEEADAAGFWFALLGQLMPSANAGQCCGLGFEKGDSGDESYEDSIARPAVVPGGDLHPAGQRRKGSQCLGARSVFQRIAGRREDAEGRQSASRLTRPAASGVTSCDSGHHICSVASPVTCCDSGHHICSVASPATCCDSGNHICSVASPVTC